MFVPVNIQFENKAKTMEIEKLNPSAPNTLYLCTHFYPNFILVISISKSHLKDVTIELTHFN